MSTLRHKDLALASSPGPGASLTLILCFSFLFLRCRRLPEPLGPPSRMTCLEVSTVLMRLWSPGDLSLEKTSSRALSASSWGTAGSSGTRTLVSHELSVLVARAGTALASHSPVSADPGLPGAASWWSQDLSVPVRSNTSQAAWLSEGLPENLPRKSSPGQVPPAGHRRRLWKTSRVRLGAGGNAGGWTRSWARLTSWLPRRDDMSKESTQREPFRREPAAGEGT